MNQTPDLKTTDLTAIFDQYNQAITAGHTEQALEFRAADTKAEILEYLKTPEDKKEFEDMAKGTIPSEYVVNHVFSKPDATIIYLTSTFRSPDPAKAGLISHLEMSITFMSQSGTWKMGEFHFMGDPDKVKKSAEQTFEPQDHFNLDQTTMMGGRIVSVQFEKDYTLVTVRMVDEDTLVFLSDRATLEKSGLKLELLIPWNVLQVEGYTHKTNPLKVWGTKAEITVEE